MIQNTYHANTEFLIPSGFPVLQRSKGLNTNSGDFLWTNDEHQQAINSMKLNGYSVQLDNKNVTKVSKNGFDKFNKYKSKAKSYNIKVILEAINNYEGNKSISALIKDSVFYETIKPKLISIHPDTEKKPSRKTLINYISEIKSADKNN
ncbi:MAG: hypothetical protein HOB13_05735 [Lentimicrobiaceae bacterium]|jgi:hypothetical protein|nr:hypothetical protein [Lentimicrobiaceae bacterium]